MDQKTGAPRKFTISVSAFTNEKTINRFGTNSEIQKACNNRQAET